MQLLTMTSIGQNRFSNVEMHMNLTVHLLYLTGFLSDRTAMNCLKVSEQLGHQHVSYKLISRQFHLQRVPLGQWTHCSGVRNEWCVPYKLPI